MHSVDLFLLSYSCDNLGPWAFDRCTKLCFTLSLSIQKNKNKLQTKYGSLDATNAYPQLDKSTRHWKLCMVHLCESEVQFFYTRLPFCFVCFFFSLIGSLKVFNGCNDETVLPWL